MLRRKSISIITLKTDTFSNPTLISFFKKCKEQNINIYIYGPPQSFNKSQDLNNVKFKKFIHKYSHILFGGKLFGVKLRRLIFNISLVKLTIFCLFNNSKVIIGIDPFGLVTAGIINKILNEKLIYFSFEIFFEEENPNLLFKEFKKKERYYSNKANIICIQDEIRKNILKQENKITNNLKWHLIPVSSLPLSANIKPLDVNSKFGIPRGRIIIIYSGTISEWSGLGYVISALEKGISENYWIFVHSRYKLDFNQPLLSKLLHLKRNGAPLTLHDEYFSNEIDYYSFLSSFHLGLALYISGSGIYVGKNIKEVGLSSGKFSSYCMLGLPSIVKRSKGYEKLKKTYNFGFLISDENEFDKLLTSKVTLPIPTEVKKLYKEKLNPDFPLSNFISDLLKF